MSTLPVGAVRPDDKRAQTAEWAPVTRSTPLAALAAGRWGWLPLLTLNTAVGLLAVACANTAARTLLGWAEPLFWLGLVVLFLPVFLRLAQPGLPAREALGLLALLGLALYLVKILHSPVAFSFHDEFYHWRTLDDVINSGRLFMQNPLLPVSARYPGLGALSGAMVSTSRLPYYDAGVLLMALARLLLVLALYLFYREAGGSSRVAGLAVAIYMANPNFVFFDAQFSYETLALPLAVVVLFAAARETRASGWERARAGAIALLALCAVVVTHHITAFFLVSFLALWTLFARVWRPAGATQRGPGWLALVGATLTALWLVFISPQTVSYLAPHLSDATAELFNLFGGAGGRQLFQSTSGQGSPLWERIVALGAAGCLTVGLFVGLWQIWRSQRDRVLPLLLGLCALAYPASLALRLTGSGWEASNRSSEFLFVALGFVVATALAEPRLTRIPQRLALLGLAATVVFCGGVIAGWPPVFRMPGPYFIDQGLAGERTVQADGIAAASWTYHYLGPDNMLATDASNMLLVGSYGRQNVAATINGSVNANWVLYAAGINDDLRGLLRRGGVQYLEVDRRLQMAPALADEYYPGADIGKALGKFDRLDFVDRIYDGGAISIYDIRELGR